MAAHNDEWSLVIPVKRLELAKSRIALPAAERADLALAMATDTVAAAVACALVARVVVVTDDVRAVAALAGPGVTVVADAPDAGLNPALRHGAAAAGGRIVAVSADLPALTAADLTTVLMAAARQARGVVADESGTGTTVLTAASEAEFMPSFGAASFRAHLCSGSVDLTELAAPSVRRDVDTLAELRDAVELGVGAATQRVVARLGGLLG
jgi:2-phospho-L-lactate guanylyltransferase